MKTGTTASKSFIRLNSTQFLGALNDNILKLLIVFYLIAHHGTASAGICTATVGAAFVLPFLLLSAPAGSLADRFAKSRVIVTVKAVEVAVTALAVAAFALGLENALYVIVFLMGGHSALFAPAKYGAIPELVAKEELSRANGVMESFTFLAIILGTALASVLTELSGGRIWIASLLCLGVALAGLRSASGIVSAVPDAAARPIALFPTEILRTVKGIGDRHLLLAIFGLAYFMFIAAFAQLNLIGYGIERLGLSEAHSGYLFLAAALGIGIGSLLAAKLSGRDVEFGIVPVGATGLGIAPLLLHFAKGSLPASVAIIVLFGVSAGLFSLPLQSFIQLKADPARRGELLAASSFINWVAILAASALTWLLTGPLALSAAQGFAVIGVSTLVLSILSLRVLPDFLLRFLALVAVRLCYRIRICGSTNLPAEGGALLIPNHVTWVDAFLLSATTQRRIRFVMERSIYNNRFLNPLLRLMQVIPVSSGDGRREIVEFVREARTALDDGYLVCIFAEGALTRNGMLQEFRGGFERIVRGSSHPIVPVYIGGAWGSILSYAHGRLLSRLPSRFPYPVSIHFGEALPAEARADQVRGKVSELSCDYFEGIKGERKPLIRYFIASARRNWTRRAVCDSTGKSLSYGKLLASSIVLAKRLERSLGDEEHVGLLLPPSVGGVLANLALSLLGRVPVNLNYSASESAIRSAVARCGIGTVITSRAFLEKLPSPPRLEGMIFLEELAADLSTAEKLKGALAAHLAPASLLCTRRGFDPDATATVIFSSGSTGDPKGVMLSHHNIVSNIEALRMVLRVTPEDNICSALPFFHSFGFTATLWLPLLSGFSAAFHTNPMDGEKIAQLVREQRSTLLIATPTFLSAYLRRAKREDFRTLRLVVTGAEKLGGKLADAFEARFGIRPLQGYGATELSPVISLNLPDVELGAVRQQGAKEGSVGHPVPGLAVRAVDPETGVELKPGEAGLLLVKGPNVMTGYLGDVERSAQVMRGGWYVTGDIGVVEQDGFIRITDRLSRFSKIGGEMVPHGVVEEELHARLGQGGVVAVSAVPEQKKGERLVVLFAKGATEAAELHRLLAESPLPNLWKPGRDSYFEVEALPLLGTGKLDLGRVKELAAAAVAQGAQLGRLAEAC